mmetsp:Transcript_1963/g.4155  ORF Transcript_1963/g.4155 Transcript_1963/m.4155 type:complete len:409 (-) Transcript_1963:4292-5518(-)
MGIHRHPVGTMDRFRKRLQDDGSFLYGIRVVGLFSALGKRHGLPGIQGHALLDGLFDRPFQLGGQLELQGRQRSGRGGGLSHCRRRGHEGRFAHCLDDYPVDPPLQPGAVRQPENGIRADPRQENRQQVRPGQVPVAADLPRYEQEKVEAQDGRRALHHREDDARCRPQGQEVSALVRLFRRPGILLPGRERYLRHRRRRYGCRPPGTSLWRGRFPGLHGQWDHQEGRRVPVPRGCRRSVHRRGDHRQGRARQGGRQHPHRRHQESRPVGPEGHAGAFIPLLLAVEHPPHLQDGHLVVRQGRRNPRPDRRPQQGRPLGPGTRRKGPVQQLAEGRPGLGHFPQPVLGNPPAHLDQRRLQRDDLRRKHRPAGGTDRDQDHRPPPGVHRQPGDPLAEEPRRATSEAGRRGL